MNSILNETNAATHDGLTLRFHDQTPFTKADNKRSKICLSPCTGDEENANEKKLTKKIET